MILENCHPIENLHFSGFRIASCISNWRNRHLRQEHIFCNYHDLFWKIWRDIDHAKILVCKQWAHLRDDFSLMWNRQLQDEHLFHTLAACSKNKLYCPLQVCFSCSKWNRLVHKERVRLQTSILVGPLIDQMCLIDQFIDQVILGLVLVTKQRNIVYWLCELSRFYWTHIFQKEPHPNASSNKGRTSCM